MRSICISDTYPDLGSGYGIRLLHVVRALAELGDVDVVSIDNEDLLPGLPTEPPPFATRALNLGRRDDRRGIVRDVTRWYASGRPRRLVWQDWDPAIAALRGWLREPYDLVWLSHADVGTRLLDLLPGVPVIVDLDNLEDEKLRRRSEAHAYRLGFGGWHRHPRRLASYLLDRADIRRWEAVQHELVATASWAVVCSEVDRKRLGGEGRIAVIPNAYDGQPVPHRDATHPVMTLISLLRYAPNADAAIYLAEEVLPLVRRRHPDVELRIVGRHDTNLESLATIPGVTLTGFVEDVSDELARADVIAAPIRFGSGTRVKLLEAFASRVPVVTTTLGCEGLWVEDGVHVLIGDDPATFAGWVCSLIEDPALGQRLADEAHELWRDRYTGDRVRRMIIDLARGVTGSTR
jgi:glycosyltransferase involved in cell wall biosynthesis